MKSLLKTFMLSVLGIVFMASSIWAANEDYRLKVRPNGYISDKVIGDIISFTVYIDLGGPEVEDSTFAWQFSLEFDGSELAWPGPDTDPLKGTNLTLLLPGDWQYYPTGGPFFPDLDEDWNPIPGEDTIGLINASKKVTPPGQDWPQVGRIPLASFDLKLIANLPMDGELDVTVVERDWRGECFGYRIGGIGPVETSPFPEGGPDFCDEPGNDCQGDLNGDCKVDVNDFLIFLGDYGRDDCAPGNPCAGDLNDDGKVDVNDFLIFLGDYGRDDCC